MVRVRSLLVSANIIHYWVWRPHCQKPTIDNLLQFRDAPYDSPVRLLHQQRMGNHWRTSTGTPRVH